LKLDLPPFLLFERGKQNSKFKAALKYLERIKNQFLGQFQKMSGDLDIRKLSRLSFLNITIYFQTTISTS
jgi:hypothetical protein